MRFPPLIVIFFILTFILIAHSNNYSYSQPSTDHNRKLSFEDRVYYQTEIEKIYYQNRTWPKGNPTLKPAFSEILTEHIIQERVLDSLKKSAVLEKYWGTSIGEKELQAEINRMAEVTKRPDMLKKLWAVMKNDPGIIAECFARAVLVDRLIRNRYSYDIRFHSALKAKAEEEARDLESVNDLRTMSGLYQEFLWVKKKSKNQHNLPQSDRNVMEFDNQEWTNKVSYLERLAKNRDSKNLPVSKLEEDDRCFYLIAILQKDSDHIRIAVVEWQKVSFDQWWEKTKQEIVASLPESHGNYQLPQISESTACLTEGWDLISGPPEGRFDPTAIWTGNEMIIWGGYHFVEKNSGGRYDPVTDTWKHISQLGAPSPRSFYSAAWTGSEMIIWGGRKITGFNNEPLQSGARYDPITDTWNPTSVSNAPTARYFHSAFWTGSEMIIWGGKTAKKTLRTGARYNPLTDQWLPLNLDGAPSKRYKHAAVQIGQKMVVWGGLYKNNSLKSGGKYDWVTDAWESISTSDLVSGDSHTVISTGTGMLVWPGQSGARYDSSTDTWSAMSTLDEPEKRIFHSAIWTGTELIVWGGRGGILGDDYSLNDGGRYNLATNSWQSISELNAPTAREEHAAIWTGSEMIIWGGATYGNDQIGGRYNPITDSWVPTGTNNSASPRKYHTSIWTGNEMIVWGGNSDVSSFALTSGGRYDPSIDQWQSMSEAPRGLAFHAAVWTGSEMIAWGGRANDYSRIGVRYNPTTDLWQETSELNAPSESRIFLTGIWTGTEAIFWGGGLPPFNDGGKYNPVSDSWQPTSILNAPDPRSRHTAIWDGSHMIVWGGDDYFVAKNDGSKYDPITDSWSDVTLSNAPSARWNHTAVWTGSEMMIWGGRNEDEFIKTGARYLPLTDTWEPINTENAPPDRTMSLPFEDQRAVWTGTEMIVGGGWGAENSVARYDPALNVWKGSIHSSIPWLPSNTMIWTNVGAILWGGGSGNVSNLGSRYCPSDVAFSFSDDFEDGDVSDWSPLQESWMIVNGNLIGSSNLITDIISPYVGCYLCTIETDLMIKTNGGSISLLAWYVDHRNFVELQLDEEKDNWILKHKSDGKIVFKNSARRRIDVNVVYHVKISFDGTQLQASIDQTNILNVNDSTIPAGTVGFRVKSKFGVPAMGSFQEIEVY